ncbi:PepSY-associated TM helix domain-containing protein [Bradyrhizobium betae]|uniref:PepSY-associated TM helix domain-containing protein n=1 Tax=Bradyrhizobium betae TaxID=244734 RepID=UPI003D67601B
MSEQAVLDGRVYERKPALRRWLFVHKWSSLICTLFLLLICATGLPLVLREEINGLLEDALPYAQVPENTPNVSLDRVVDASRKMYPGETIISVFVDDDEPKIMVYMASSWEAFNANRKSLHSIRFDAHSGDVLKQTRPFGADGLSFLQLMLTLHSDLFMGLPGELFLGAMALLFIAAIVSGIAIYGPFMRKLDFGTVRASRSRRLKWLDLHNLLGVATLGWALVVGATGVINELSTPLFALWQQTDVRAMLAPLQGKPVPQTSELSSPQAAYDAVRTAFPDMITTSVVYPGAPFGSPFHYVVWTKGKEPLTSRLFSPVLVDARSGVLTSAVTMPWYLRTLELSRPLHFGDYGGMPLKIIWVLLDLFTIFVLGSGLYIWFARSRAAKTQQRSAAVLPLPSPGAAE